MSEHFKNLKGYINKQVTGVKFRFAGSGRRLNDQPQNDQSPSNSEPIPRVQPSQESQRAGQAALSRLVSGVTVQKMPVKKTVTSQATEDAFLCKVKSNQADDKNTNIQTNESLVHFQCPLIGPDILTYDEWIAKIKQYLEELIAMDQTNLSYVAVLIKSVNEPEKANFACEKLKTCLQNILDHPEEEKYKKIKANNPLFKDKLLPIYGCEQYLLLCGFNYVTIDDIKYLLFQPTDSDINILQTNLNALNIAEPIHLILDRNTQVIKDSHKKPNLKETDDFFQLTSEEVRLEAAKRHDEIEDMKIIKTQAMRKKSAHFNYDAIEFAVIKIKFPDGMYLQGIFRVNETIKDVQEFVLENLKTKSELFNLLTGVGRNILNPEKTLSEEKLIPSSLLYFEWKKEISSKEYGYLNDEILALIC